MTVEEANKISIKLYLADMNICSVKEKNTYGMYFSLFRTEQIPSFKVDYRKNLWYDFGSGEGGTMIDLMMKIHKCSFHEAMIRLEKYKGNSSFFSFQGDNADNRLILRNTIPLNHTALIGYLRKRRIDINTARKHCEEIHYSINDRNYFAIGFKNNAGGYELRNPYFKGTISPKGITTVNIKNETCRIFEGFMDYLSYLTMENLTMPNTDILVLNSIIYLEQSIKDIAGYTALYIYFDNDETGKRAIEKLQNYYTNIKDCSVFYLNYKDLNDYLCKIP